MLTIYPNTLKQCPKCGQTAKIFPKTKEGYIQVFCKFCIKCYIKCKNVWYTVSGETVDSEYDPLIDTLHELAKVKYNTFVVYLTDKERELINSIHSSFYVDEEGNRAITIKGNIPDIERIIALSHEIGHLIDFVETYASDSDKWLSDDAIVEKEKRAWRKSLELLSTLGFDKWDQFLFYVWLWFGTYTLVELDEFVSELKDKVYNLPTRERKLSA